MKDNNVIILVGALLAGAAYKLGQKNGKTEIVQNIKNNLLDVLVDEKFKKDEEAQK